MDLEMLLETCTLKELCRLVAAMPAPVSTEDSEEPESREFPTAPPASNSTCRV